MVVEVKKRDEEIITINVLNLLRQTFLLDLLATYISTA